ncbi:MAG TPA: DUF4236 domain-containing protein [Candidatus Binatia bacterium]
MGYFRFRRSIKLLPGIRLNIGKKSSSVSVGVRGAHVTFGKTGTRTTVGVPGTGLSYTQVSPNHDEAGPSDGQTATSTRSPLGGLVLLLVIGLIAAAMFGSH